MKLAISHIAWPLEKEHFYLDQVKLWGCSGIELAPSRIWDEPIDTNKEDRKGQGSLLPLMVAETGPAYGSLADKARLDETLADNEELFAGLNLWERHSDLVVVPDGLDLEQMDLSGYALDAYEELAVQARQTGEASGSAADALALLYRLQRGGDR